MVNITDKVSENEANILTAGSTKKISTQTISSTVASVDITIPTSGYTYVYVILDGMDHDTDNTRPTIQISDDGFTTTGTLDQAMQNVHSTLYDASYRDLSSAQLVLIYGVGTGLSDERGYTARFDINIPTVSGFPSVIHFRTQMKAANNDTMKTHGIIESLSSNPIDTIRLSSSAGNLISGTITVYGVS